MRALLTAVEGHVCFGDVDEPVPGPDEALVAVRAVSINRGEALDIADSAVGALLGWDLAGVVLRAADSGGPQSGTRVVGVPGERAWAALACVSVGHLAPIPDDVSDEDAAALPVAGLTALRLLRRLGSLRGRSVVIPARPAGSVISPSSSPRPLALGWSPSPGIPAARQPFCSRAPRRW